MMISEELKKDIYRVISTFEEDEIDELMDFIKDEKASREQYRIDEAKQTLRNCLFEIEDTLGVGVYGEEGKIYVDDLDFCIEH